MPAVKSRTIPDGVCPQEFYATELARKIVDLIRETCNEFCTEDAEDEARRTLVENSLLIMSVIAPNTFALLADNENLLGAAEKIDGAIATLKKYLHWKGENRLMNNNSGVHRLEIF